MDLSGLQLTEEGYILDADLDTTLSITGDCAAAPGPALAQPVGVKLRPLLPRQCLLLVDESLLIVSNTSLWMDNLYIRLQRSSRTPDPGPYLLVAGSEAEALYLSGITLQGDGVFTSTAASQVQSCQGLYANSPVYMQGCTLSHLGGDTTVLSAEAAISIVNTTIVDNSVFGALAAVYLDSTTALLRGVTFARNNAARLIVSYYGGAVYSDTPLQYYERATSSQYAAASDAAGAGSGFLSPLDAFFTTAASGVSRAPVSVPAQATGDPDAVAEVATPQQLQQAVQHGARHIVVTAHMDLTALDAAPNPGSILLGFFSDTTFSIQGNCQEAPQLQLTGPPLLALPPGQCVLVTDMDLWQVRFGRLWMHNLYLRHTATVRDEAVALITSTDEYGQLWLTQMTMQGAGAGADGVGSQGLTARGPMYVEGCHFSHLGGTAHVVYVDNAPVHIVNSTFSANAVSDAAAAIVYLYYSEAGTWLQGSAFVNNSVPLPLVASYSGGGFASDVPREFYDNEDAVFRDASSRPAGATAFLSVDDRWLANVQAVFPGVSVSSTAAEEPPTTAITAVTTAEELQAAVVAGARHIEVQAHMDLSSLHYKHGAGASETLERSHSDTSRTCLGCRQT